jgi:hypothetical protein
MGFQMNILLQLNEKQVNLFENQSHIEFEFHTIIFFLLFLKELHIQNQDIVYNLCLKISYCIKRIFKNHCLPELGVCLVVEIEK